MTRKVKGMLRGAVLLVGLLAATSASAGGKVTKLPADYAFPSGEGSPGKVTFSHASHVDTAKPSCVACHPQAFRILESGRTATGQPIRHQQMEAGAGCGACHGKTAFAFDSCDTCHKS
jgi:c(7)-type cytochrome triheme protein